MEIYNLEKYSKSSGRDRDIYVIKDGVHYYFSNDYLLNKKELMWIGDENETVFEYNIDFLLPECYFRYSEYYQDFENLELDNSESVKLEIEYAFKRFEKQLVQFRNLDSYDLFYLFE